MITIISQRMESQCPTIQMRRSGWLSIWSLRFVERVHGLVPGRDEHHLDTGLVRRTNGPNTRGLFYSLSFGNGLCARWFL